MRAQAMSKSKSGFSLGRKRRLPLRRLLSWAKKHKFLVLVAIISGLLALVGGIDVAPVLIIGFAALVFLPSAVKWLWKRSWFWAGILVASALHFLIGMFGHDSWIPTLIVIAVFFWWLRSLHYVVGSAFGRWQIRREERKQQAKATGRVVVYAPRGTVESWWEE